MGTEADAKRVFLSVLEAPATSRAAAADAACTGDPALRARVEELLRGHDAADAESTSGRCTAIPERIGAYRIRRVLAAGGMGVVYEAEQDHPRRLVALKVLRAWALTAASTRRFELEAELLGRLRHPGIAQVYEAGRAVVRRPGAPDEDAPFIAMELIPGATNLARHARARPLRERIRLLADVCAAVQAAHERGVIHRDLKPGNILVGDDGRPRVIDFGVARLTDPDAGATLHTAAGQLVGTLGYMSPELAAGGAADADVRTDVYALGVLLYELAADRPPHDLADKTIATALRTIQERDAVWPPGRGRLWRDLGAIALKAMARHPGARYESTGAMARDLERLLAGEPVEARPPGRWARLARWTVRHPVAATACVCVLAAACTLAATGAGIYWLALRPDHLFEHGSPRFLALRSRGGHVLHIWDAGPHGRTRFQELVDRPGTLGGGRIALIGFEYDHDQSAEPGHVEAYDAAHPDRRLWSTADSPLSPPGAYASRRDTVPAIERAFLADILDASPGPEVVVLHALGGSSPTAIRIFDLAGRARYEVWHEGAVLMAWWLPGARRLVLCGLNCEARWDQRGVDLREPLYPCFVAGVEPRDGHRPVGVWLVERGRRTDPTLAWYRWLGPLDAIRTIPRAGTGLIRAGAGWDDGAHVTLSVAAPWRDAHTHLMLTLDADGMIVGRATDDAYKLRRREDGALAVEAFELLEYEALPPPAP